MIQYLYLTNSLYIDMAYVPQVTTWNTSCLVSWPASSSSYSTSRHSFWVSSRICLRLQNFNTCVSSWARGRTPICSYLDLLDSNLTKYIANKVVAFQDTLKNWIRHEDRQFFLKSLSLSPSHTHTHHTPHTHKLSFTLSIFNPFSTPFKAQQQKLHKITIHLQTLWDKKQFIFHKKQ